MGKRREYREIASVEEYLSTRSVSAPEKNRIRGDLAEFLDLLEGNGRTWPSEEDYRAFREMRLHKDKTPRTVIDRIQRIRKYYEWRQTQAMSERQGTMMLEGQAEAEAVNTPKEKAAGFVSPADEHEGIAEASKPKRGRKPKAEEDRRSEKISIYLTPRVYADMRALAHSVGQDISDIFFSLAEDFVERNSERLNAYRDFLAQAKPLK